MRMHEAARDSDTLPRLWLFPEIVYTFACEVFLKSLIFIDRSEKLRTHDLMRLFEKLASKHRATIEKEYEKLCEEYRDSIEFETAQYSDTNYDLRHVINERRDRFVNGRYAYEGYALPRTADMGLKLVSQALRRASIAALQEKYPQKKT